MTWQQLRTERTCGPWKIFKDCAGNKESLIIDVRGMEGNVLRNGVPVCDAAQHHSLDNGAVLLFRQAAMGHQRGGQLGGRGGVHALKPFVALNLVQRRPFLGIPLQHAGYKTGGGHRGGQCYLLLFI